MLKRPDDTDPRSISHRLRRRRFRVVETVLDRALADRDRIRVLDAGGRSGYWRMLRPDLAPRIELTVLNIPGEPQVDTGAPDGMEVRFATGDACAMPEFADAAFDVCHSNSVIEHVGSLAAMRAFADETRRVARFYYHQTPNLAFPVEPHYGLPFVHWLPGPTRARLVATRNLGYGRKARDLDHALAAIDHTEILSTWLMRQLFPEATLLHERILLLPKSIMVHNAG